jgi:hypothetical protein
MPEEQILNRLEHRLLSMQVDAIEPLYALYADTNRDIEGATLALVLKALLKLVSMGFSKCLLNKDGELKPYKKLTLDDLRRRFASLSEEKRRKYPNVPEYFFEITEKGRIEEAKEIYDAYYPPR